MALYARAGVIAALAFVLVALALTLTRQRSCHIVSGDLVEKKTSGVSSAVDLGRPRSSLGQRQAVQAVPSMHPNVL
jgi:hypothetical protein